MLTPLTPISPQTPGKWTSIWYKLWSEWRCNEQRSFGTNWKGINDYILHILKSTLQTISKPIDNWIKNLGENTARWNRYHPCCTFHRCTFLCRGCRRISKRGDIGRNCKSQIDSTPRHGHHQWVCKENTSSCVCRR